MTAMPIRLRLTMWYSVMFATAAILLSLTSWRMLRYSIDASVRQDLQERVDDVREQLRHFGPALGPQEFQARMDAIYKFRDDGKWLQIAGQNGEWIYRSQRMASASSGVSLPGQLPPGGSISEFWQGPRHVRTLSSRITVDGRSYSVETGIAMNKPEALLRGFGIGLLLLTPAVLMAAIVAGHMMSRKALGPVAVLANEARRITDRNLDARLPVPAARDEISHLSETLNSMLARLDAGFRSARDFTANASHELRTPLARLRAEVEIALMSPRSAQEYRDTLEHMQEVAVDMTRLLEDLLTLARAEAGSEMLRLAPVDLGELIDATIEEWRPVAEHLSLDLRRGGDLSGTALGRPAILVSGDRPALLRLLRIWLDNACKFTPAGGSIEVAAVSAANSVFLSVQDSGIGISAEHQERVFERFYRVQGDTGRRTAGSGLGLSMAAWIAEQHKTSIGLKSAPGAGSRFEIALARALDGAPRSTIGQPSRVARNEIDAPQRTGRS